MSGPSPIQAARARHHLAEIAQRTGIHLPTHTGSLTVRCPLATHGHPDHSPSMRLYLDDDRYYCFGCSAKGDVVDWVTQTEHVSIPAAIAILDSAKPLTNAWAGHTPAARQPEHRAQQPDRPDLTRTPAVRVLAALQAAWEHYSTPAARAQAAAYLTGRGIHIDVLEARSGHTEAGHTPQGANQVTDALRAQGFSDDELVDAGLAHRHSYGALTDFYRDRLLIPVRDDQHRVIGIVGRNTADQDRWPKYKNPPRTTIYDKSVDLYQPLPNPTHPDGHVIVVEGTLDAIAVAVAAIRTHQDHLYCPLTQSGRELSPHQLQHILEMHPNPPILAFDSDPAGQDSARRYQSAFAKLGQQTHTARLPAGQDPASWLCVRGPRGLAAWTLPGRPSKADPTPRSGATRPFRAGPATASLTRRPHVQAGAEPISAQGGIGI